MELQVAAITKNRSIASQCGRPVRVLSPNGFRFPVGVVQAGKDVKGVPAAVNLGLNLNKPSISFGCGASSSIFVNMSYPVNYLRQSLVRLLRAVARPGRDWQENLIRLRPFCEVFKIPQIDTVPDTALLLSPSHTSTTPARPALVRACTSATLIDTDFLSDALSPIISPHVTEFLPKTSTDNLKSIELVDRLHNHLPATPALPVEDGNLGHDAPVVNVAAPPLKPKARRSKKRPTKETVRWAADVIEREIQANRPVTGRERLERLRRLGHTV